MRIIHTSDWQLSKPFGRVPAEAKACLEEARLDAIDKIAAAARERATTWVLVAGDVFDSPEPGDRIFRQSLARMKAAEGVRWALLPGNHDPARADGLWTRLVAEAPPNVIACLTPEPRQLDEAHWLLPAPLYHKRSSEDPTAWFERAETPPGAVRIGLAHGPIQTFGGAGEGINLIAPDRAQRSGLSYLALGDWHGRLTINPFTHYSGTPEPDDFGREVTGVALSVKLKGEGNVPDVEEIRIGRHVWKEEDWPVTGPADLDRLVAGLAVDGAFKDLVVRLNVSGLVSLADRVDIRTRLEAQLAHEIRWLDLRLGELFARPSDHDLADIDTQGVLRDAAERLLAMSRAGVSQSPRALAALERLYIEHQKAQSVDGA